MRRGRGNRRALSEIVGTLMLVLIVVSAAVAFSLFLASYQKQLTQERSLQQQRGLESLRVLGLTPVANGSNGGTNWTSIGFLLASEDVEASVVASISVNGNPLAFYTASPVSSGGSATQTIASNQTLAVGPRAEFEITVTFTHFGSVPFFSFFDPTYTLPTSSYITIEVFTAFQNDFHQSFVPPTALATISTVETSNGGFPLSVPFLDGSNSFQPGGNGTIVGWSWSVTNQSALPSPTTFTTSGEKARFPPALSPAGDGPMTGGVFVYTIVLTVTNSNGLTSSDTLPFTS